MNNIIRNTALAALFAAPLWIGGCNKENDFYEVGRQPVTLTRPAIDTVIVLDHEHPDSLYTFAWHSRRHFIDYKLRFGLDEQFTTSCEQNPGVSDSWRMSTLQLDSVLSSMNVAVGATVKLYWTVEVVDPEVGWCDEVRRLTVTRCELPTGLILLQSPASEAKIVLDKKSPEAGVAFEWECPSTVPDYTLHVGLDAGLSGEGTMTVPCRSETSHAFTMQELDDWLAAQGIERNAETAIYWQVTSTVSIKTAPSETRSLRLTGMLRPYTDLRDPASPETYAVVKIGEDIWMAENLRALSYSDGTAFTTVDVIYGKPAAKTFANDLIGDAKVRGVYYSWPTALRTYEEATEAEDTRMQGVCPEGWHLSTMQEWKAVQAAADYSAARVKSAQYWTGSTGTNDTGLSIVPAGKFWHGNVPSPDNADDRASFWTTTKTDATTAQMFEVFGWSNEIVPWNFNSRPWSEGDGTASMLVNVRCVRDRD